MNASTIPVHWHDDNQPVYSVAFQPTERNSASPRLVTGGGDNNVRVWSLGTSAGTSASASSGASAGARDSTNGGTNGARDGTSGTTSGAGGTTVEYLTTLTKHTQAVNVVRFNPSGDILATAGDDGTAILWQLSPTIVREFGADDDIQESWTTKAVLRTSTSEIYDLAWSPCGNYVATGSMDHHIRVYHVSAHGTGGSHVTGGLVHEGNYHGHYIQGMAWDPRGEFLVSQSADRSIAVLALGPGPSGSGSVSAGMGPSSTGLGPGLVSSGLGPGSVASGSGLTVLGSTKVSRADVPNQKLSGVGRDPAVGSDPASHQPGSASHGSGHRLMYHSETLQSFFRRPAFSPDGSLLVTPSGVYRQAGTSAGPAGASAGANGDTDPGTGPSSGPSSGASDDESNTVFIFTRANLTKPVLHLPGFRRPAIAVAFSPVFYSASAGPVGTSAGAGAATTGAGASAATTGASAATTGASAATTGPSTAGAGARARPVFSLPHKMIFAVATQDSIIIYDTVSLHPLGVVSNVHYSTITDLAWDQDGQRIIVSSADGFCSTVRFEEGVFGTPVSGPGRGPQGRDSALGRDLGPSEQVLAPEVQMAPESAPEQAQSGPSGPPPVPEASAPAPSIVTMLKKEKKRVAPTLINN